MSAQLYRHFDGDGQLLYVGVSLNVVNRLAQHRSGSSWYNDIKRVDVEAFETREQALDAERKAISGEHPTYNIHQQVKICRDRVAQYHPEDTGFTTESFADAHSIGKSTVYQQIKSGRLKARKVNGRTVISAQDAKEWLDNLPLVSEDNRSRRGRAV
jgi:GIY-YIG catalytic domain